MTMPKHLTVTKWSSEGQVGSLCFCIGCRQGSPNHNVKFVWPTFSSCPLLQFSATIWQHNFLEAALKYRASSSSTCVIYLAPNGTELYQSLLLTKRAGHWFFGTLIRLHVPFIKFPNKEAERILNVYQIFCHNYQTMEGCRGHGHGWYQFWISPSKMRASTRFYSWCKSWTCSLTAMKWAS